MVLSARNHPCVFSYSIGNEIPERDGHGQGALWARTLADKVRSLDPERPVTCGVNGLHRPGKEPPFLPQFGTKGYASLRTWNPQDDYWSEKTEAFCEALDFVGYNYMYTRYAHDREKYPNRAIVATESFPALTHAYWEGVKKNSNVFGDFIWTAFDYLGEAGIGRTMYQDEADRSFPAAYPWHQANTADFSICGLRTAQSYYREIMWNLARGPHLRATSPLLTGREFGGFGWNWDDSQREWNFDSSLIGKPARVDAYADADEVEFTLNGKNLGRSPVKAYIATVEIPYAPGKLEALAYRNERLIGTDLLETSESAAQMTLEAEPHALTADGMSLCYIELTLCDKEGRVVTNEDRTVLVRVRGAGTLAALGTDDPLSEESYADCRRRTFRGKLLIVLRSGDASGTIEVTAECDGMTAILKLPVAATRFDASFSTI